jgi:hypothetical protein
VAEFESTIIGVFDVRLGSKLEIKEKLGCTFGKFYFTLEVYKKAHSSSFYRLQILQCPM